MAAILEQRDAILSRRSLLGRGAPVGAATGAVALGLSPALRSTPRPGRRHPRGRGTRRGERRLRGRRRRSSTTRSPSSTSSSPSTATTSTPTTSASTASATPSTTTSASIRDHEGAHVETLTAVITDLGGEPVEEAAYDFGVTDAATFLATAAPREHRRLRLRRAGQFLEDPGLLTAAGTIVAVEARHASYLNLITGEIPFPAAFETPLTTEEVLEIAGPFIQS
jgi:hypothetical protein